jgi:hypothetical protein
MYYCSSVNMNCIFEHILLSEVAICICDSSHMLQFWRKKILYVVSLLLFIFILCPTFHTSAVMLLAKPNPVLSPKQSLYTELNSIKENERMPLTWTNVKILQENWKSPNFNSSIANCLTTWLMIVLYGSINYHIISIINKNYVIYKFS